MRFTRVRDPDLNDLDHLRAFLTDRLSDPSPDNWDDALSQLNHEAERDFGTRMDALEKSANRPKPSTSREDRAARAAEFAAWREEQERMAMALNMVRCWIRDEARARNMSVEETFIAKMIELPPQPELDEMFSTWRAKKAAAGRVLQAGNDADDRWRREGLKVAQDARQSKPWLTYEGLAKLIEGIPGAPTTRRGITKVIKKWEEAGLLPLRVRKNSPKPA